VCRLRSDGRTGSLCSGRLGPFVEESLRLLVDLIHMSPDRLLDMVGVPGGPLADASLWHLEVVESGPLSRNLHRVVLSAPGLDGLRYSAGQDLMLRIPRPDDGIVNRRYTVRAFDAVRSAVTIDISLHGAGPGTDWIRGANIGDRIDAIGPRGKITLQTAADWHLFVADETGLPGVLAMLEALPPRTTATALLEIDTPADEQVPDVAGAERVNLQWLHRLGRTAPGDSSLLVEALADVTLPTGTCHAYLAAEAVVVRTIREKLGERGFGNDQISAKAYWRRGLPNAEHGEPTSDG
jgi:NADPH-dependent ferric siderophore reductase